MRSMLKSELWKATHNKFFCISIAIGMLLSLCDVVQNWLEVDYLTNLTIETLGSGIGSGDHSGFSLFVMWIAVNGITFGSRAFYFVFPVLAALPYGWSLYSEIKSGAMYQYSTRAGKNQFYISKYVACFLSGGLAVAIPILFNLLTNALICPYALPNVTNSVSPIRNGCFLSELYYTAPWMHALIWCFVDFVWGGVAACLCLVLGKKSRFQFVVIVFPFVVFYMWDVLYNFFSSQLGYYVALSPLELTQAATLNPNPEWAVLLVLFVVGIIGAFAGYWRVVKSENL